MRQFLLATISFLLVGSAMAQSEDSIQQRRLIQPRIYWDYGKTLMLWSSESKKHEGGIELLLSDRIQLIGEAGYNQYTPTNVYKKMMR